MLPLRHRDWHFSLKLRVYLNLETVLSRVFERDIECEYSPGFHLEHARRWFGKVDFPLAVDDFFILFVQHPNLHVVLADLGTSSLQSNHEVQAGMYSRELLNPNVMENADH